MKALLIRPPSEIQMRWANIPLGIGYIAGVLERDGVDVTLRDYLVEDYLVDPLIDEIRTRQVDIVGLSVMTIDSTKAKEIIQAVKKKTTGRKPLCQKACL